MTSSGIDQTEPAVVASCLDQAMARLRMRCQRPECIYFEHTKPEKHWAGWCCWRCMCKQEQPKNRTEHGWRCEKAAVHVWPRRSTNALPALAGDEVMAYAGPSSTSFDSGVTSVVTASGGAIDFQDRSVAVPSGLSDSPPWRWNSIQSPVLTSGDWTFERQAQVGRGITDPLHCPKPVSTGGYRDLPGDEMMGTDYLLSQVDHQNTS